MWKLLNRVVLDEDEFAMGIRQFHGPARSIDLFKMRRDAVSQIVPAASRDAGCGYLIC